MLHCVEYLINTITGTKMIITTKRYYRSFERFSFRSKIKQSETSQILFDINIHSGLINNGFIITPIGASQSRHSLSFHAYKNQKSEVAISLWKSETLRETDIKIYRRHVHLGILRPDKMQIRHDCKSSLHFVCWPQYKLRAPILDPLAAIRALEARRSAAQCRTSDAASGVPVVDVSSVATLADEPPVSGYESLDSI